MKPSTLLRRNLAHYWRTNLAVVAGVATTVAVLAGALLVGDSVRASLRALLFQRLGNTSHVVAAEHFFREQLAADLRAHKEFSRSFPSAVPLIALEGMVTHETSGRRASGVQVYGVDARFWKFHNQPGGVAPRNRDVLLSEGLAKEFAAQRGDAILVRVQRPSDIPLDSLHGRKEDLGRTVRLTLREVLPASAMGEFSVRPQQGVVRAVFVPLQRLQQDLQQEGKANSILVSESRGEGHRDPEADPQPGTLRQFLQHTVTLEDLNLRLVARARQGFVSLESDQILINEHVADAAHRIAHEMRLETSSVFTYLANAIRIADREIPYSLVTAIQPVDAVGALLAAPRRNEPGLGPAQGKPLLPIWLNDWAARDLRGRIGDGVTLEYYVWQDDGRLISQSAQFELRGIVPLAGAAADPHLTPTFPGITDSEQMGDWNPPFPIDLKRVRRRDEDYWDKYRTTPKAFIPLEVGQQLWASRFGRLTSIRFHPEGNTSLESVLETISRNLPGNLTLPRAGISVIAVRAEGTQAAQGAVNFSTYFIYFSFFLVFSGVLLTGLFFKLGVEQRLREIGLLRAVGFPPEAIGKLFFCEGILLAVAGSLLGVAAALGYGALMMYGLRTWWIGAVGTTYLRLHVAPVSLMLGGAGGIAAALLAIAWTLRSLRAVAPRNLLAGTSDGGRAGERGLAGRVPLLALGAALIAAALLLAASLRWISQEAGFFGAGALLLAALTCAQWTWLARRRRSAARGVPSVLAEKFAVPWLGFRNASWRPGRSLLCIALIAAAAFVIVAVDAFRRDASAAGGDDKKSGTGGYPLLAESLLPILHDPNSPDGRTSLNLSDQELATLSSARIVSFRVRPGDDASCLNLYQPRNPKVLGVSSSFIAQGRFAFQDSLARTPEEKQNPWRLLETPLPDGAIPAIVDANSLTYVLRLKLGDEFVLNAPQPVRLRIVAALRDTLFQSELLIADRYFLESFPRAGGYRFFLMEAPPQQAAGVASTLESAFSDYGFDAMPTADRLAAFHRVENTYISTFQALGGLGLLLGTVGLAAVLLRNVLERRRELALLRAVGYRPADLALLVVAENAVLLSCGLLSGIISAFLAIAPALSERGAAPAFSLGIVLVAVPLTGLAASLAAVAAVIRMPMLASLRAE